jgi:hypothetical protein
VIVKNSEKWFQKEKAKEKNEKKRDLLDLFCCEESVLYHFLWKDHHLLRIRD